MTSNEDDDDDGGDDHDDDDDIFLFARERNAARRPRWSSTCCEPPNVRRQAWSTATAVVHLLFYLFFASHSAVPSRLARRLGRRSHDHAQSSKNLSGAP